MTDTLALRPDRVLTHSTLAPPLAWLLVAAAYFAAARLGLWFAVPPGYASALFPASGLALAAVLLGGRPLAVGVWLGSTLANLLPLLLTGVDHWSVWLSPVGIGGGAALQALFGHYLMQRYVGVRLDQADAPALVRFMLIVGAGSCVVSASVGNALLLANGQLPLGQFGLSWLTWYIGDTAGVLVVTPLIMLLFTPGVRRERKLWVALPLLSLIGLLVGLYLIQGQREQQSLQERFELVGQQVSHSIAGQLQTEVQMVEALRSLFAASEQVTRAEFQTFVRPAADQPNRALVAVFYSPRLVAAQVDSWQAQVRQEGFLDFAIHGPQHTRVAGKRWRDELAPILYVEPLTSNGSLLGLDLALDTELADSLNEATFSQRTALAPRSTLDGRCQCLTVVTPQLGANGQISGYLGAAIDANRLLDLRHLGPLALHLELIDNSAPAGPTVIWRHGAPATDRVADAPTLLLPLQVAGQRLSLRIEATRPYLQRERSLAHFSLLAAGMLCAALVGALLLIVTGHHSAVTSLVEARTEQLARSEFRAHQYFEQAGVLLLVMTPEGVIRRVNGKGRELLGGEDGSLIGRNLIEDILPVAARKGFRKRLGELTGEMEQQESRFEISLNVGDGGSRTLRWWLTTLRGNNEPSVLVSADDITEQRQAESRMRLAYRMVEDTNDAILLLDARLCISWANAAFTRVTGYSLDEVCNQPLATLQVDGPGQVAGVPWDSLRRLGHWKGEVWSRRKDGETFPEWLSISLLRDDQGEVSHYVAVFTDITLQKEQESQLFRYVNHDALTGLANRNLLRHNLEAALARAHRSQRPLALLFIDLDRFKRINDSLGHNVGDGLLQAVAKRLTSTVRQSDTVARLGGDEYAVVLEELHEVGEAAQVAQKLIGLLSDPYPNVGGYDLNITPSIGICVYPDEAHDVDTLLKHADIALHHAKQDGPALCRFFSTEMNARETELLLVERQLRQAIRDDRLQLYYQPKIGLPGLQLDSIEALMRWQDPLLGWVPPSRFIPVAEETGLIDELGDWALRRAAADMMAWQAEGREPLRVAVNLSARQFRDEKLPDKISDLLRRSGLDPHCLEIEITESCIMQDVDRAAALLQALKQLGIKIAIDDFGTGYSSLGYLKRFPIDYLKIDRSFVMDIPSDSNDMAIAEAVIGLGHSLGMQVVAEGVETPEQLDFLRARGCDAIQGYLFARPMPLADLAQFADQTEPRLRLGGGSLS